MAQVIVTDTYKANDGRVYYSEDEAVVHNTLTEGHNLFNQGKYDKAIDAFTGAINYSGGNAIKTAYDRMGSYVKRGEAYLAIKEYNKAIADFTIAIEGILPDGQKQSGDSDVRAGNLINRAIAYKALGNNDLAIADCRKAIFWQAHIEKAKKLLKELGVDEDKFEYLYEEAVAFLSKKEKDTLKKKISNAKSSEEIRLIKEDVVKLSPFYSDSSSTSSSSSSSSVKELDFKDIPDVPHNFTGKGKYKLNDYVLYEGDFVKGKPHGKGKETHRCGDTYEGDWVKGFYQGKGKRIWADNGDFYEGDFFLNKRQGKGKMAYADGIIKQGKWKDDKFVG